MDATACLDRGFSLAQTTKSPGCKSFPPTVAGRGRTPGLPARGRRVGRDDPRAVLPGLQRVLGQPAGDGRGGGLLTSALDDEPVQLSVQEARERQAVLFGQLAGDRSPGDLLRGKTAPVTRARSICETIQSVLVKALAPPPDQRPAPCRGRRRSSVGQALGSVHDHLRPLHVLEGARVAGDPLLELGALLARHVDRVLACLPSPTTIRRRRLDYSGSSSIKLSAEST